MFIGYEVKSNQNQAKATVLDSDIKLSQAVLDPSSVKNKNKDPVCLMAEYNKKQFILAVLDPNQSWQCPLDLMFAAGSQLKLFIRGSGTVHVTGFEHQDDDDFDMSMSDSDLEGTDESEVEVEEKTDSAKKASKEKGGSAKKTPITNGNKSSAKKSNGKEPVKLKPSGDDSSDMSDSSDSGGSDDSSDDDDEDYLNFEDSDDDGEGMDDEDDEQMDDDDDDDDEEDDDSEIGADW